MAQNHLESLELSGYIRFLRGSTQGIARFGTNVNRDFLRNVDEIKSTLTSTHRIVIEDDFVVAKSDLCFIYICRKEHEIISIDILEDTLSAFLETLNTWLENYLSKRDVSNVLQCSLIDLIESSQNLVNCHQKASEDLLKTLSSNFPQLGLKTHQEERILELVQKEQREHIDLIESQIKKNNGLVICSLLRLTP